MVKATIIIILQQVRKLVLHISGLLCRVHTANFQVARQEAIMVLAWIILMR